MSTPRPPDRSPAAPGHDHAGQRFGHITGHPARTGAQPGTHLVHDDETGITYAFGYADIVTKGSAASAPASGSGSSPTRPAPGTRPMSSAWTCPTSPSCTRDPQPPASPERLLFLRHSGANHPDWLQAADRGR